MSAINQKQVSVLVQNAIKSDLNNENTVKEALAYAIKLAAGEIGRFEELNDLWKGVSAGTMENIRQYMINLLRKTGVSYVAENGKTRVIGFFKFNRAKLWHHLEEKGENYRLHRDKINAMTIEELMAIPLGREKAETEKQAETVGLEAFELRIARAIKFGLENDLINTATANEFNKLINAASRVDPAALEAEKTRKLMAMQKAAEKAGFKLVKTDAIESAAKAA